MNGIGVVIAKKRKEAGISQTEFAKRLNKYGFDPSGASVSSWEKDVSVPNALQFLAICEELGIKDIASEFMGKPNAGPFSGLNGEGVKRAKDYISLLLLSDDFRAGSQEKTEITELPRRIARTSETGGNATGRTIRLYDLPASAGTGEFLDGEEYSEVPFSEDIPSASDFGLRIKGNSMEPLLHDGQVVWVKKTSELTNGEIGIFLLDGNAFCKKLNIDENGVSLVSINRDYKPIQINEDSDLIAFGKVLNR